MDKIKKHKTLIIVLLFIIVVGKLFTFILNDYANKYSSKNEKIYNKIEQYFKDNLKPLEDDLKDYHTFVELEKLGIEKKKKEVYVYVWALIESYYVQDESLKEDIKMSLPYRFVFQNDEIVDCNITKDGDEYLASLKELFPPLIYERIKNGIVIDQARIDKKVAEYYAYLFPSNANTVDDYMDILWGDWDLFKATKKGKEIPLTEIFGTAVSKYGGKLILKPQGTYTEFIGVYSDEEADDLQGSYEIKDNIIYLTTSSGKNKTLKYLEKDNIIEEQLDKEISIYFRR